MFGQNLRFFPIFVSVSGFGRNATDSDGRYQNVMKEVDVPLVDFSTCQKALRSELGNSFNLDRKSFVCAGGEDGKGKSLILFFEDFFMDIFEFLDSCTGDGGAPLSCFVVS
jgi:hypothetical protein